MAWQQIQFLLIILPKLYNVDGLMQDCINSIANAMELL